MNKPASKNLLGPVRIILGPIPTPGEKVKRAIAMLFVVTYISTTSFLAFGKVLDIISDYHARVKMDKKIESGDWVAKKAAPAKLSKRFKKTVSAQTSRGDV